MKIRKSLSTLVLVLATAAGGTAGLMTPANAAPAPVTQNGWPAIANANSPSLTSYPLPGTWAVKLRGDGPGTLLVDLAQWFDRNIEPLRLTKSTFDEWGWSYRPIRGATTLSNHSSGTALDLNATLHPLGTSPSRNLSPAQINKIHARLAVYEGAIRWGGDYVGRKDPMHFEINANWAVVHRIVLKLYPPCRRCI